MGERENGCVLDVALGDGIGAEIRQPRTHAPAVYMVDKRCRLRRG
jgi:hypothetical protein